MTATDARDEATTPDIFRDSPVRYLGYANELGESFRPLFPRFVGPSYAVAIAYVLGDTYDKGLKAFNSAPSSATPSMVQSHAVSAAVDTLLWQGFASVAIPGFLINRLVAVTEHVSKRVVKHPTLLKWGPTCVGLGVIPFIIHPIDHFVDYAMDNTTRVWSKEYLDKMTE
ncbi:Aste57867_5831 [Aphanomyces stellatus]|uniref:Mitochondrial fission process protein 1 n=1 Tax=Aphanomyces stellatus TaxID=120398 RepID=A0A485KF40_9STRA|nr:hypothetical protein As57867_005817 [Aphanomyces stellatus]VFT82854.1 Aste57867_5831 [Aphanomyces stellatus]